MKYVLGISSFSPGLRLLAPVLCLCIRNVSLSRLPNEKIKSLAIVCPPAGIEGVVSGWSGGWECIV